MAREELREQWRNDCKRYGYQPWSEWTPAKRPIRDSLTSMQGWLKEIYWALRDRYYQLLDTWKRRRHQA